MKPNEIAALLGEDIHDNMGLNTASDLKPGDQVQIKTTQGTKVGKFIRDIDSEWVSVHVIGQKSGTMWKRQNVTALPPEAQLP